jgi:ABC-type nitrate/sulfonate/bicarbonate transport system substrate-binding protein
LRAMVVLPALLMAPVASAVRAQQATEVRVAMLAPSALLWLHAIARDQGFYTAQQIVVKELVVGSSPALLQAVASGSVDAGVSLGDVVIRAIDRGAPVVMTGAILEKTILRLVGGTGVVTMKDLAGANPAPSRPFDLARYSDASFLSAT